MPLGIGAGGSSSGPMNTIAQSLHENDENHENVLSLLSTSHGSSYSQSDVAQSSGANDADEDTDMSVDGGVPIPLINSSAQQLNLEMDMLDAELMGPYNLAAIAPNPGFHGDIYPTDDDSYDQFTEYAQEDEGFGMSYTPSVNMGEPLEAEQPTTPIDPISELSDQLQNIQNGQQMGSGPEVVSAGPHGVIPANGTTFITPHPPHPSSSPVTMPLELLSHVSAVMSSGEGVMHPQMPPQLLSYLSEVSIPPSYLENVAIAAPGPPAGFAFDTPTYDGETIYDGGSIMSDTNSNASSGVDSNFYVGPHPGQGEAGNMTLADNLQVEDQRNLTLGDFLFTWGASVTRGNPKKRRRGPNLVSVERMRSEKPSEILERDLRGDRCDFQGIDWTKLEVSRRDAREKRNHSYRNYTNLRTPGWHVSTSLL